MNPSFLCYRRGLSIYLYIKTRNQILWIDYKQADACTIISYSWFLVWFGPSGFFIKRLIAIGCILIIEQGLSEMTAHGLVTIFGHSSSVKVAGKRSSIKLIYNTVSAICAGIFWHIMTPFAIIIHLLRFLWFLKQLEFLLSIV